MSDLDPRARALALAGSSAAPAPASADAEAVMCATVYVGDQLARIVPYIDVDAPRPAGFEGETRL